MRLFCSILKKLLGAAFLFCASIGYGQIVINEFVIDERTAGSGLIHPSTREFVELYNTTGSPINIAGWTLGTVQIGSNFGLPAGTQTYTLPAGASIPAGGYYVIGHSGVPNVNYTPETPAFSGDLFPDGNPQATNNGNFVFELRDTSNVLKDAVAVETFRGDERANLTSEQLAFTGGGIWQQLLSPNAIAPNSISSMARYRDGLATGANGRDFGFLPLSPGATNNRTELAAHVVPNVNSLPIETPLSTEYYSSFALPQVITPTFEDGILNPSATAPLPAPLTGGNAVILRDTPGGVAAFSRELVQSFDIYAYIDTAALAPATGSELTTYGIGSTDAFFALSNSAGLTTATSTANGNTGVGWLIQRAKRDFGSGVETRTVLQLINFDDGGDSLAADEEWDVIHEVVLTGQPSAWHRLAIDYDDETGMVTGRFNEQTFEFAYSSSAVAGDFNTDGSVDAADYVVWRKTNEGSYDDWKTNFGTSGGGGSGAELLGTFYVGYREALAGAMTSARPATFVQYQAAAGAGGGAVPEPSSIAMLGLALAGIVAGGRRRD